MYLLDKLLNRFKIVSYKRVNPIFLNSGLLGYNHKDVRKAIERTLDRSINMFGRTASDSVIIAVAREWAEEFLKNDLTNLRTYVGGIEGKNYDCDDFSESVRVHLSENYGYNSIGVIWGDFHAWNFFVLLDDDGPEIMFFEPQSDEEVDMTTKMYGIKTQCSILL